MRGSKRTIGRAWINVEVVALATAEARGMHPYESGGVLLGYIVDANELVIGRAIGPGPQAEHGKAHFVPDSAYHESEIAREYEASGRLTTYLGDWHSHPNCSTRLSMLDRRTLAMIAKCREARMPTPIMAIIGSLEPLNLCVWQYRTTLTALCRGRVAPLEIAFYK
ncbi:MAG: Mov34/MPN/PAD-1 family protein [Candidatus Acidiferrales bacterium]